MDHIKFKLYTMARVLGGPYTNRIGRIIQISGSFVSLSTEERKYVLRLTNGELVNIEEHLLEDVKTKFQIGDTVEILADYYVNRNLPLALYTEKFGKVTNILYDYQSKYQANPLEQSCTAYRIELVYKLGFNDKPEIMIVEEPYLIKAPAVFAPDKKMFESGIPDINSIENGKIAINIEQAGFPKFRIGDSVRILRGHYERDLREVPGFKERFGRIIYVEPNVFAGTGPLGNTKKYSNRYAVSLDNGDIEKLVFEKYLARASTAEQTYGDCTGYTMWISSSAKSQARQTLYSEAIQAMNRYELTQAINRYESTHNEKGEDKVKNENVRIPEIDRVIFNDPATIIFWKAYHYDRIPYVDKNTGCPIVKTVKVQDKTVVKCAPGEKFNKYQGFCAAVAKYIFGTNSEVNRIVKNGIYDSGKTIPGEKIVKRDENGKAVSGRYPYGDKKTCECKYYNNKCGRKHTCKQTYDCDGVEDKSCKEYQKNEKKRKGSERK